MSTNCHDTSPILDKKNLHVSFLINCMLGGGSERSCLTLIRSLLDQNYKIDLILLDYHNPKFLVDIPEEVSVFVLDRHFKRKRANTCSLHLDKIRWINQPMRKERVRTIVRYFISLASFRLYPRLRHFYWASSMAHYLRNEKPDLVYANLIHSGFTSLISRHISRIEVPVIWAIRCSLDHELNRKNMFYFKRLIPDANRIHAVSWGVAEDVVTLVPEVRDRVITIFNPVDPRLVSLAKYPVEHPWLQSKSESTSGTGPRVILAIGRLVKQKNFTMLVRAFATIRSGRDVRLIILGEGKERTAIEKTVYELNIQDSVSMPGWVHNPYAFMARADLFVLSSSYEGLPGVLIQALACGCPVVSTNCPYGPSEILENGRLGRLVPVDDPVSLAKAITATLDEEPNRAMLKNRANDFSSKHLIRQYEDLFNTTIAEAGNHI